MIRIENLHKNFGNLEVLKGVSLNIKKGEIVSIIGSSGSGKSTLLRCINLLETLDSGKIIVDGIDINQRSVNIDNVRKEIGMVFQSFNLFENMNVLKNCMIAQTKVEIQNSKLQADKEIAKSKEQCTTITTC